MIPQNQTDVSVVIPTYDRTILLAETVRSVASQTCPPREIIVVDNGPSGHAAEVLTPFGDAVTLIREEPLGKQVARNRGLHAATSSWVAFLDDDDLWHSHFLEVARPAMLDPRVDVIGADHRKFCDDTFDELTNFEMAPAGYWDGIPRPDGESEWSFVGKFPLSKLLRRIPLYPSMTLIRRELALRLGGYDPRVRAFVTEDIEFLARLLNSGKLGLIWKPLIHYRRHEGNASRGFHSQLFGRWKIFEFIHENGMALDPEFIDALGEDLPRRRRKVFDAAAARRRYDMVLTASPYLRDEDWTATRRVQWMLATLATPVRQLAKRTVARRPKPCSIGTAASTLALR